MAKFLLLSDMMFQGKHHVAGEKVDLTKMSKEEIAGLMENGTITDKEPKPVDESNDADALLAKAKYDAKKIIDDAKTEAEKIIDDAKTEAEKKGK